VRMRTRILLLAFLAAAAAVLIAGCAENRLYLVGTVVAVSEQPGVNGPTWISTVKMDSTHDIYVTAVFGTPVASGMHICADVYGTRGRLVPCRGQ